MKETLVRAPKFLTTCDGVFIVKNGYYFCIELNRYHSQVMSIQILSIYTTPIIIFVKNDKKNFRKWLYPDDIFYSKRNALKWQKNHC